MASQDQEELDDLSLSAPVAVSFLPDQDESALASEKGGITGSPRSVARTAVLYVLIWLHRKRGPLCSWGMAWMIVKPRPNCLTLTHHVAASQ